MLLGLWLYFFKTSTSWDAAAQPVSGCGTCNRMNLFGHGARLHSEMEPGSIWKRSPIWKWSPPVWKWSPRLYLEIEPGPTQKRSTALFGTLLGNGARLFIWKWSPAVWKWSPRLHFGNGARPHPETEHGSIWNVAWKWSPALFGNAARLHLEMEPGSCRSLEL